MDAGVLGVFLVSRIIDGDTIEVTDESGGGVVTVRILGIDSPESRDPRTSIQCWAGQSTSYAEDTLSAQRVTLRSDPTQDVVDAYQRVLAYVLLPDGRNFSVESAGAGASRAYTYETPVQSAPEIEAAEAAATQAGLGLWGAPCFGATSAATTSAAPPVSTQGAPPADTALDPQFDTCGAAIEAGYGPYRVGVDPEYRWYKDGDSDGVNCER